ncbi:MAG: hypothetical protein MPW14_10140 [Candidatus Manganitrophus sp.]|nr:MAG: hypothetical protein MPW17_18360 [Candidatus Manganitrophus sp.]WDT82047.1 MAG: hypothetical protein MPW14_10140 [Candidatus Manganitrophus sp.]
MPTNIKIIQTQDFIRAAPDGALDLTASRDLLKDLVTKSVTAGKYHVLVDTRGAEVRLSIPNIFELGVALAAEPALARQKVAILVPPEAKANAEFFETVGINRGANLRVFTDFETAIKWLIMKEQP